MEINHIATQRLEKLRKEIRADAEMSPYRAGMANGFEWVYSEILDRHPEYVKIPRTMTKQQMQEAEARLTDAGAELKFNGNQWELVLPGDKGCCVVAAKMEGSLKDAEKALRFHLSLPI